MLSFQELPKILRGKIISQEHDDTIKYLSIDSRKIIYSPNTLFFAIQGERHDGHQFIPELASAGVRNFIVEKELNAPLTGVNILLVNSVIDALQALAAYHRSKFSIPVMGITGSSGKTIIKEWLFQLMQHDKVICRSPKSFNSQVGVPLSVWQINEHHEMAILEAGISQPGEMENLEKIIKPTIGIFTNIGPAHDADFSSREEKAYEKSLLFKDCEKIIFCKDDPTVINSLKEIHPARTFTWSMKGEAADLQLTALGDKYLQCTMGDKTFEVEIPGTDLASCHNSAHCIATLLLLKYEPSKIAALFNELTPISMRLELKKGINNCSIIDDSYNNDLAGLEIALDFLTHQGKKGKKTVILSDILTSGLPDENLYQEINQLLDNKNISRLIGVGERIAGQGDKFSLPKKFYTSTRELAADLKPHTFSQETILVKGARNFQLEYIVEKLALKMHSTVLEINLDALTHNLNYYKSKLNPGVEIMAMVKAFAYGSGSVEIARWLQFHKVNYLAVAYADEGAILRSHNVEIPIMVMNPTPETFDKIISYNLEPEIYSISILKSLLEYLENQEEVVSAHLKIDTGMRRLGLDKLELEEAKPYLQDKKLKIESVFTHLAAQENPKEDKFTGEQVADFESLYEEIVGWLHYKPKRHVLNSAGALRFPEFQFERVRLGIGLYGIDPAKQGHELLPVATFRTIISQVKNIKEGESVGYSRSWKAPKDMKIATIPVGYADGFDRRFSNGVGHVIVNGKEAKVIGHVCMDMTMIELGDIEAGEGDSVIIYGPGNTVQDMAEKIGTIPYELLTGIGDRVKRIFVSE